MTSRGNIEFIFKGNNGPVLLYIHGSPGGCDQNIEPTQKYRVLTPSRPGYRRTDISVGKTPEQQADSFKALLDTLEIDKVFIKGEKMLFTYKDLNKDKRGNIFQCDQDIDSTLKNIITNDYLMIKGSNATGLNNISNSMIKGI